MVYVEDDDKDGYYRLLLFRGDFSGPTVYKISEGEAYELMLKLAEKISHEAVPLASLEDKHG